MRNNVKVIDKIKPNVTVGSLEPGQMFRYPASTNSDNVYMVISTIRGPAVVLLSAGIEYTDFNKEKDIEVVDAVSISR